MSAVVFLLVCFLSCSVSEELQEHVITADPGDDVTLPCKAPNNVNITAVEWIRSNLERLVYMKSDGHLNTADQDPSYVNRVQLKDDEMKNGELSLRLKNVKNNDEGTYVCRYVEEGTTQRKLISIVYLDVKELQIHQITAKPGDDVTLPCKAPNNINIAAVQWNRFDIEKHVYMKSDGRLETADQDPSYENRVQLKNDKMKNGELSLILKNVNNNDEGAYVCQYKEERATKNKLISIVYLDVRDLQIKQITAKPGRDVILPCKAPNNVIIAVVEWIRSDLDLKKHVYLRTDGHPNTADQDPSYVNRVQLKDDEMKNGELSLILKNVNNNDEGTYECRYLEETGGRWKRADQRKLISIVQLKVEGHTDGPGPGPGPGPELFVIILSVAAAAVCLVAVSGIVGLVIYKKCKGRSENNLDRPVDDPDVLQQLQKNETAEIQV